MPPTSIRTAKHRPVSSRPVPLSTRPPGRRSCRRVVRRAAAGWLALLALLVHVYAPPGFMPAVPASGHGPIDIVLCTGHGPLSAKLDLGSDGNAGGGRTAPGSPHAKHDLCPFSSAAPLAPTWAAPAVPVVVAAGPGILASRPETAPRRAVRSSVLGARAPPAGLSLPDIA